MVVHSNPYKPASMQWQLLLRTGFPLVRLPERKWRQKVVPYCWYRVNLSGNSPFPKSVRFPNCAECLVEAISYRMTDADKQRQFARVPEWQHYHRVKAYSPNDQIVKMPKHLQPEFHHPKCCHLFQTRFHPK